MSENITLISLNAHLKHTMNCLDDLHVFSDMDIFKEEQGYLFIYQIEIGKNIEESKMMISMVYRIDEKEDLQPTQIKDYLHQIHPYLLDIVHCLLQQCIKE